jgi:hypothetical protein
VHSYSFSEGRSWGLVDWREQGGEESHNCFFGGVCCSRRTDLQVAHSGVSLRQSSVALGEVQWHHWECQLLDPKR